MTPSDRLIAAVKQFEGFRQAPYLDAAGYWTVGYGHKLGPADPHQPITKEEAEAMLARDLAIAGAGVEHMVKVPLTQGQFDALTDFVFNFGSGRLSSSTLLTELNAGCYDAVPHQLARWVYAAGKEEPGLVARRQAEAAFWTEKPPVA